MKRKNAMIAGTLKCHHNGPPWNQGSGIIHGLMKGTGLLFCCLAVASGVRAEPASAANAIDDCKYSDTAAAQAAWKPMEGSAPVSMASLDGSNELCMPCNFASNLVDRAYWDRSVKMDLQNCDAIQFKIFCPDSLPVTYFSIYFRSGDGWYYADFYPESSDGWNTITISKPAMKAEGQPSGWGQIKSLRISAWRGQNVNTMFYLGGIRGIGGLGDGVSVIVLKSDSSARRWTNQISSFQKNSETVAQELRACGIASVTISDDDLPPAQLAQAKLVVLPQDPVLPDDVVNWLTQYVRQGGKVLAFYSIPVSLRQVLDLEGGDQIKAARPGSFAQIKFEEGVLPDAPGIVAQNSENISSLQPVSGKGRVLADWLDDQGKSAGYPAVIATSNCIVMTHVLLPGDDKNKAKMLLALTGELVPKLAMEAVETSFERVGQIASYTNYEEAVSQITKLDNGRRAAKILDSVAALHDAALKLADEQKYSEAIEKATEAGKELKVAFCMAQQPLPGEFRAFWCHSPLGVPGMDWDEAIHRLADNGFTAIFANMCSGGVAYYPSKVLPVSKVVSERGDQLSQCLAACRKYGIQLHVWKLDWNLNGAPKEFIDKMRAEHRLQMSSTGKEMLWLCPSDPANRKLEIDAMLELVRNYDLDGIHFDYIRYPGPDYCFNDGCKERFQAERGVSVQYWPKDVLPGGPLYQQWLDWRRDNITTVVKAVSEQARAIRPNIKISAAVFRYWNVDRDYVGQDWKLWCDKGYLDFVCPMDYTPSKLRFENMVLQQVKWAGKVPCYPGLGASSTSSHFGADRAIEEIDITRQYKTGGFIIFDYGANESKELLPMLGMGITRPARANQTKP